MLRIILNTILIIITLLTFSKQNLLAEKINKVTSKGLFASHKDNFSYEIGEIRFIDNNEFNYGELFKIISSRPTVRNLVHEFIQMYYDEGRKNKISPGLVLSSLESNLKEMENEVRFFSAEAAERDVSSIKEFYNVNGFHDADVHYEFSPDSSNKINVLSFFISEGKRYKLDTLIFFGLEKLPFELKNRVKQLTDMPLDSNFNESDIANLSGNILTILLNNGYNSVRTRLPIVSKDTINKKDSVSVFFDIGSRKKIGAIRFTDLQNQQETVVDEIKKRQLTFSEGDWYNRQKIRESQSNLLSLGTFESVIIDLGDEASQSDSIITVNVISQYTKQKDWSAGMFYNQTLIDDKYNLGLEFDLIHRNVFGAAQNARPYTKIQIKDISRTIKDFSATEFEFQLGVNFTQPLIWVIQNSRVAGQTNPLISYRSINNLFFLRTISLPIRFPIRVTGGTYFNQLFVDFWLDDQKPIGLDSISRAGAGDASERQVQEANIVYGALDAYQNDGKNHFFTSNLMGLSLISENRNHPFAPTRGWHTNISFDGWNFFLGHSAISGIAKFLRFQFAHLHFFTLNDYFVLGTKARIGITPITHINDNKYVPIERQFFAGGANSNRGWESRQLRYSYQVSDSLSQSDSYNFYEEFIGNAGIFESTIELRLRFPKYDNLSEMIAGQVNKIGFNAFIDIGNAFGWYYKDTPANIGDWVSKLAYSTGMGMTYETPFGPIRFDLALPIYGPKDNQSYVFFPSEHYFLGNLKFHIALGHSF